jgi:plastocyanin
MPISTRALAALSLAIVLAVAACSSPSTPGTSVSAAGSPAASASGGASGGAAAASAVTIQGFSFGPASLTVPVGATVTWTNKDPAEHTVTADDGSFESQKLPTGQTFSQTFAKAGTFSYHCTIHPTMTASITVH